MESDTPLATPGFKLEHPASSDPAFDPQLLADDLEAVRAIYADFFLGLSREDWDRPSRRGPGEWNVHTTVAHLCGLTGAGLESVQATLRGEPYEFAGLTDRYQFNAFNGRGIEAHLAIPMRDLCAEFLGILVEASSIARTEPLEQLELASEMPIYNRPVKIIEALAIMLFHAGLHHTAQVTDPTGAAPLWQQLSPGIRHRTVGRVLRAMSLLYRYDLGEDLRAVIAWHIAGPGGGDWHIDISPQATCSAEGFADHPTLTLHLAKTDVFCQMFTGRLNLPLNLLTAQIWPSGDVRLFTRLGALFSVDARKG